MRAVVVGSGAGGATVARELSLLGFDVLILEAGGEFKPFTRRLSWAEPLRRTGLLGKERTINRLFPHLQTIRCSEDLVLVRGITTGGSTVLTCGNMVRAMRGLKDIDLDLTPEFKEIEEQLRVHPLPKELWRAVTRKMFDEARRMDLHPRPSPKAVDEEKCNSCGMCELGCATGARWDSRRFLKTAMARGAEMWTGTRVTRLLVDKGKVCGVEIDRGKGKEKVNTDLVILCAGGMGTPRILKASGLSAQNSLWADVVLTLGGRSKGARQLEEPPMAWYSPRERYIISPYVDILSHWFHRPWKGVPINERVGLMIKLADDCTGELREDGTVVKELTERDRETLEEGVGLAQTVMANSGVSGPYVSGMLNGGHLGGTVPLRREDLPRIRPSFLPEGVWISDLSLVPRSQGLPTMETVMALSMRVARQIAEECPSSAQESPE
ncbi:MAG: GMC family oxidoreductase N-terminal domain-containing protein [Methanomassiliicoccales archaeon]